MCVTLIGVFYAPAQYWKLYVASSFEFLGNRFWDGELHCSTLIGVCSWEIHLGGKMEASIRQREKLIHNEVAAETLASYMENFGAKMSSELSHWGQGRSLGVHISQSLARDYLPSGREYNLGWGSSMPLRATPIGAQTWALSSQYSQHLGAWFPCVTPKEGIRAEGQNIHYSPCLVPFRSTCSSHLGTPCPVSGWSCFLGPFRKDRGWTKPLLLQPTSKL